MSVALLMRLAAAAAIVGGILRVVDSFAFEFLGSDESVNLFLVTDIALIFALVGAYGFLSVKVGWLGFIGFAVALIGFILVRSAADDIDAYVHGAAIVAVGIAILGIAILIARAFSVYGPVLWIVALIAGFAAYLIESDWLFEFAGVAFGLGFVATGAGLWRQPASVRGDVATR